MHYNFSISGGLHAFSGDSMTIHDGQAFSISSHDNDIYSGNCAQAHNSGWWFKACGFTQLTGLYGEYPNIDTNHGIIWRDNWDATRFARFVAMAIQRK